MKITFIETWQNGTQLLGSDFTSVVKNIDTPRKLDNAIKRHIQKLKSLENIKPFIKNKNYEIKYSSQYK